MAWLLRGLGGILMATCLAFIALVLLAKTGLYNPYPSPPDEVLNKPYFGRSEDVKFNELHRRSGEPLSEYHERLTKSVNAWMVHWWPTENRSAVGVHPLNNCPMWLKSFVPGYEHFGNKEFVDPLLAWRSGYGVCSQVSRVVYSVLRDQGLDATIMEHPNHVVVEAGGHVLDADYGVFIPHSLSYLQQHPELVKSSYEPNFVSSFPILERIYRDGWTETSTKERFDYMREFEGEALRWEVAPVLLALWLSIAIFDAGFCWPRFAAAIKNGSRRLFARRPSSSRAFFDGALWSIKQTPSEVKFVNSLTAPPLRPKL